MTSNVGTREIKKNISIGFSQKDDDSDYEVMRDKISEELKRLFNPEFLNRLDDSIFFKKLSKIEIIKIVDLLITEMSERLKQMRKEGASEKEIGEVKQQFDDEIAKIRGKVTKFILEHPARGKIGAFEGAGYKSTGLYRPTLNSIMHRFNNEDKCFYKVRFNHWPNCFN